MLGVRRKESQVIVFHSGKSTDNASRWKTHEVSTMSTKYQNSQLKELQVFFLEMNKCNLD